MRSRPLTLVLGLLLLARAAAAATIRVAPDGSIQAAVDAARPGDTVLVEPGTYHEAGTPCPTNPGNKCAVVITKDGIRLVGLSSKGRSVVLENPGGQDQGIAFAKTGNPNCLTDPSLRIRGALVSGFTVNGFDGEGIFLFCADNWRVTQCVTNDNAEYGIFPSHCGNGRVDHSLATGANDTGIYVGQSHDVRVDHNRATGNVSGFEVENSARVRVHHNEADGNTGGILTFTLPGLDVKSNDDNRIDHNRVHDNNKPNTCLEPTDEVCGVPPGTGILVLAANTNLIEGNTVTGNKSFGIGVVNFCVATNLTPAECAALDIEPNPDGNRIKGNTVTGNGTAPDPSVPSVFTVDLAWDLSGTGNCWQHNVAGTIFPDPLPACR
jgi:parallel beta-helix repeat protein